MWLQVSYWSSIRIQSYTFLVILFHFLFSGWLRVCLSFFCVQMPSVWIRLDHLNHRISPRSLSPGISSALCLSQDPLGNSVTCWKVRTEVSLCIYTPHFMLFVGSLWLVFGGYGDFFDEKWSQSCPVYMFHCAHWVSRIEQRFGKMQLSCSL